MKHIIIYGKPGCKYCKYAVELCNDNSEDCTVEYVDMIKEDISKEVLIEMVGKEVKTIPQIFVDGEHIGGYDSLTAMYGEYDI